MEIRAERVGVNGPHGPLLQPTSLRVRGGEIALVTGEPGPGHTTLALTLAGRLRPSSGSVTLNGRTDAAVLRKHVALVDAPDVNEPEDGLKLSNAIAEELLHAGLPSNRNAVRKWLQTQGADIYAGERVEHVPAAVRTRLLVELAASRPGVQALMIDTPDRHTSDPGTWWPHALRQAEQGLAVVVFCSPASASALPLPAARLGHDDQPDPMPVLSGEPQ
ncbi:energy-coupling factor transporter ATP-binding protein EcfA2 [Kibdelosporangium banguiense]|uniref:Energy-coupling factor transporter ATP-binding protein EcfA2 n=1 Tax=Kibdelosporangium banguiense TaxID=1365924 RepID=A0ABS4TJI6_9PSEU|nr:ATP-binding cassette domain-containing protein [Kibdelosporangium banguiense]MBP2324494.1 energy-coupling factor transporter ATP-binding protein EcfA2 [Kibdelosporangium banguiense]